MIYPKPLTKKHIEFLNKEFDINISSINDLDVFDDALHDDIFEKLCNIEVHEICKSNDTELSERGILASEIVTFMGGPFEPDGDWVGNDKSNPPDIINTQIAI